MARKGEELPLDMRPMEAEAVEDLPSGEGWLYERKYDGFRCLAFKRGSKVHLQSKNQKPLERYFPELAAGIGALPGDAFVLDGEIVLREVSFETLQLRLHPAASRIEKLSKAHPAQMIVFDLLANETGEVLADKAFSDRREALEALVANAGKNDWLVLSKATHSLATAKRWLGTPGLEGIMAKRLDLPYAPGKREMQKFKQWTTIDCVVGGLYFKSGTQKIESLLLGLYDEDGALNYVGRTRLGKGDDEIAERLYGLVGGTGFTGRAPGGKSRWSGREREPIPLKPEVVAEVSADHITGEYMRHGARLLRFRPDKNPEDCLMDQIRRR